MPRSLLIVRRGNEESIPALEKRMRLRYAGVCRECTLALPAGTEAIYERPTKTVRCVDCPRQASTHSPSIPKNTTHELALEHSDGTPGSSARREHARRKTAREERIRDRHPRLGGAILALTHEPQSTRAWDVGAIGEERLGRRLDSLAGPLVRILHDRRIPGSRANIDHIVICPTGVLVIDAKRYKGRPRRGTEGGLFSPRTEKLLIGTRNRTHLIDAVLAQTQLVREAIDQADCDALGVLCFIEADWPLIGGDFHTQDIYVTWPRRLATHINLPGPLTEKQIDALQRRLLNSFPSH